MDPDSSVFLVTYATYIAPEVHETTASTTTTDTTSASTSTSTAASTDTTTAASTTASTTNTDALASIIADSITTAQSGGATRRRLNTEHYVIGHLEFEYWAENVVNYD